MFVAITIVVIGSVYVILNVVVTVLLNYKAHQFFKTRTPNLPVLPKPSMFAGHLYNVAFQDKNWLNVGQLHDQYGPTFGFYMVNQPWVCTKDLDLIKLVELDRPLRHINRGKIGIPFKEFKHSIFQMENNYWRRVRRALATALTNHMVRGEEILEQFNSVLELVKDGIEHRMATEKDGSRSAILDVDDMSQRYTLAVIFKVVYGCGDKIDFRARKDFWSDRMDNDFRSVNHPLVAIAMMFPFVSSFIEFLMRFHSIGRFKVQVIKFIVDATNVKQESDYKRGEIRAHTGSANGGAPQQVVRKYPNEGDNKKRRLADPIIDALVEKRINYDEFINGLVFLLLAGFKTSADTLTCLVWHLAQHQHVQEQLRNSILDKGIDSEYLDWCIQETIRYHPAVPLGTGRILGEDVTVNGLFLPKGTHVMPSSYSIHHDSDIWPEPEEFKPERWRDTSGHHAAAFMGFGLGPRNCVGGKLAMQEIKLAAELLLTNYSIEKCPETVDECAFSSPLMFFTTLDQPIKVRLVALKPDCCKQQ